MRLAIGAISHVTNTFVRTPTDLTAFAGRTFEGATLLFAHGGGMSALAGAIAEAERSGVELAPLVAASAPPGGIVSDDALAALIDQLSRGLAATDAVDGLLLQLSGAMVAESAPCGDAVILQAIRGVVGPALPIAVLVDSHANLTSEIAQSATILEVIRGDFDRLAAGRRVLQQLASVVAGESEPVIALRTLPLLVPLPSQRPANRVMRDLGELANDVASTDPGIVSVQLAPGYPYADVPHAGFSVVATAERDQAQADSVADRLAETVWERRASFNPAGANVEEAVHLAMAAECGTTLIVDLGDDPAAGGSGDATALLWALLDLGAPDAALAPLVDAEAVTVATASGLGNRVNLSIGGGTDRRGGYPVEIKAIVRRVGECSVVLEAAGRHGGSVEIIVVPRPVGGVDAAFFQEHGIEPGDKRVVAVKASTAHSSLAALAARVVPVTTPGLTCPVLHYFEYAHVRRPIFPLDTL